MSPSKHLTVAPVQKDSLRESTGEIAGGFGQRLACVSSRPLPYCAERRNLICFLLFVGTILWYWHPLVSLVSLVQQKEQYSHIALIPFMSLCGLYLNRKAIFVSREWSPWLGMFLVGIGAWLNWFADASIFAQDHLSIAILALVTTWWGIVVWCFGGRLFRKVAFELLFLLFMVPIPSALLDVIVGFLQQSSAEATDILFFTLGVPVFRDGFVFSLSNFTIYVAEECSGIRSALALFITSLVAGHMFLSSAWGKIALLSIVVPLAIIKNAIRIVGLALLANYVDPSFILDSAVHRNGGIPLFLLSLVVLFSLVWVSRRIETKLGYVSPD